MQESSRVEDGCRNLERKIGKDLLNRIAKKLEEQSSIQQGRHFKNQPLLETPLYRPSVRPPKPRGGKVSHPRSRP